MSEKAEGLAVIILQLCLYCGLFTALVAFAVRGGAINGLYFYPKAVQERAFECGLADRSVIERKHKRFLLWFSLMMLAALVMIIGAWNGARDFKTAYLQALLFLEVMNWYDGIVIDKLWVGHSKFWIVAGTEDIPFIQTWKQVMMKRGGLTLIWLAGAAVVGGLVILIF